MTCSLALTVGAAASAFAQVRDGVQIQAAPASNEGITAVRGNAPGGDNAIAGKESNQGVYVRDSAVAVDKFALAGRMEKLKDWNKAADALQEVVEKYADRVMPSQVDAKNVIYQYTSVTTAVQERLAKWPAEGLDVYRARFEPQASAMLEAAAPEDIAALHKVYSLYFVTDAGKTAGIRLVDHYLEAGEFPAAAWLAERLLAWHPTIEAERPKLTFRASLAYHLAGDEHGAKAKLDELKQKFTDAKGLVHGEEVALAASLEKDLATAPPVARGASGDSWPMFGGSPDRGRVPEAAGQLGALISFVEYARERRPRLPALDQGQRQADLRLEQKARDDGVSLGVMPAIDRGEMFFQDNQRLYAVSLETGVALPGWAATYGDRGGRYTLSSPAVPGGITNVASLPRNQQFTVTLTDGAVLAVMGQLDTAFMQQQGMVLPNVQSPTRLVCLDRTTGKERWTAAPNQLPESNGAVRNLVLCGSPLAVGDNVFVLARGGKPMQFEDSYVLCYSLKDGSFRWACYLASGNVDPNNAMQNGMGIGAGGDNVSHLAYASGRLYALTNLGALAAVDAYSGTIVWLNIYPRPKPDFMDFRMMGRIDRAQMNAQPKPWHHNPVIVKEGKVFILPDDAQHVLVYDAGSGVEVKRIRTEDYERAKTLLGIVGDQLVLCSDRSAFCVNWSAYDPKLKPEQNLHWRSVQLGVPTGSVARPAEQTTIRGRGFVTTESVFIPTARALYQLSLKGGKVQKSYPRDRAWDAGEGPGNVLVTQDHVIVAATDRLNVYTDLTVARARLDAGVDAAPKEPEPRLRYAEMMFVSNQLDVGLQKLDEAIALLSDGTGRAAANPPAMRPGPARDRVFNIALTFAEKLADPEDASAEDRKLADELYERARQAADSPAQQVNYRMTRARTSPDPVEQVRLYQEVLSDDRLRTVLYADDETGATGSSQAAQVAEKEIGKIIKRAGKSVYAAFDAKAAEALATAQAGNDAAALLAVAESYPNALVAPEAMMAAADAYESAGKFRSATEMLTRVLRRYPGSADKARVIESQVRNSLRLPGGVSSAIGRLATAPKGARLHKPVKMPDGSVLENVTLTELASALHAYNTQTATSALADFNLPDPQKRKPGEPRKATLPERPDSTIPDVDLLVTPQRDFARHDRVITWTANKGLSLYAAGETKPLGSAVAFPDTPKGAAWVDDKALVWGPTRAVLLAGDNGAMLWEMTIKGLPQLEVAAADDVAVDQLQPGVEENERAQLERRLLAQRLRAQRNMFPGNAVAMQPQQPPPPGAGEQFDICRPTSDRAVFSTSTGRVLAVEMAGGKVAWQTRLVDGPLMQLLASDEFVVARFADASGVQIAALDTFAGQPQGPRRVFPLDGSRQPINMALSPDGTLVFTFPSHLCGKNLFETGKELNFQVPDQPDGTGVARFAGANLPDQLVVANGRVIAVCDNGQYVRTFSLENGKEISQPLQTGVSGTNWAVFLRPVGSRLYVINPRGVVSYNLDRVEDSWGISRLPMDPPPAVRDALIGQDYIVLLDQLSGQNPNAGGGGGGRAAAPRQGYRLLAYRRALTQREGVGLVETGLLDYDPIVTSNVGISSEWQGVNGGFYYRTLDRTVHFLRGARPANAG